MQKLLLLTAGEPAGIGPELCLKLFDDDAALDVVVVGDAGLLRDQAEKLSIPIDVVPVSADEPGQSAARRMPVISFDYPESVTPGLPDPGNVVTQLEALRFATDACLDGRFAGLVTAPLQKSVINDAGIPFSGHTEFLAERCGASKPVMLLVAGSFRVALATTHMPLREVADAITADELERVLRVLDHDLKTRFDIQAPTIAVCGLNPHAGENGHLGTEEQTIITPLLERLRQQGMHLRGPLPADTLFTPAGGHYDAALAMYHDQGLPVLKHAGFGTAVNVTLGLPIVRTSVDHGTALDIAGKGLADVGSLRSAVELARQIA